MMCGNFWALWIAIMVPPGNACGRSPSIYIPSPWGLWSSHKNILSPCTILTPKVYSRLPPPTTMTSADMSALSGRRQIRAFLSWAAEGSVDLWVDGGILRSTNAVGP